MSSIVVKVSDLYERVKKLKDDNMQYVQLLVLDSTTDDDDVLPPSLEFNALQSKSDDMWIDYEGIDAIEDV